MDKIKSIQEVDGKILVCDKDCTYNLATAKGNHSWGCRYGTLEQLKEKK